MQITTQIYIKLNSNDPYEKRAIYDLMADERYQLESRLGNEVTFSREKVEIITL